LVGSKAGRRTTARSLVRHAIGRHTVGRRHAIGWHPVGRHPVGRRHTIGWHTIGRHSVRRRHTIGWHSVGRRHTIRRHSVGRHTVRARTPWTGGWLLARRRALVWTRSAWSTGRARIAERDGSGTSTVCTRGRRVLFCGLDDFIAEMRDEKRRGENRNRTHSSRFRAAQRTTHSTQSSLPSPRVCQTAFSSGVLPVMLILVPPPFGPGGFFWILPNSMRLGGML
jgi:hypothetical protein